MKVGRNDPCPCGSGKKFKKCCLGKNREASATPALGGSASGVSAAASGSDPLDTLKAAIATAKEREAKTPKAPRDPVIEKAESIFKEFEAQTEEGRIALFLETLKDAEMMDDEMAFAMLGQLHTDAAKRGERCALRNLSRRSGMSCRKFMTKGLITIYRGACWTLWPKAGKRWFRP